MIDNLTSKLNGVQTEKGLSDREMAKRLGCKRQLWQMTRTGDTPLGMTILAGIAKNFPEFQPDIQFFLVSRANRLSKKASE